MKISEITNSSKRIDLEAVVKEKEEAKEITTRYGKTMIANAILEDDSGTIKLVLWGENATKINEGDKIKIENGFTSTFKGELQLQIGRYGKITVLE